MVGEVCKVSIRRTASAGVGVSLGQSGKGSLLRRLALACYLPGL